MQRTFAYAELLLIGISATTISAAVIGDPLPVVGPSVAAALLVAGHHVHHRERTDDHSENTRVYADDESDGYEYDGLSRRRDLDGQPDDEFGEVFAGEARADGGNR